MFERVFGQSSVSKIARCPLILLQSAPRSSFKLNDAAPLATNATTQAITPVPANEIDTRPTGFAVARPAPLPATQLSLLRVTKDAR